MKRGSELINTMLYPPEIERIADVVWSGHGSELLLRSEAV